MSERVAQQLAQTLKQRGYKLTNPRIAILNVLATTPEHLSAAEVWKAASEGYPEVGRATAFRTLDLLVELGLARPLHLGDAEQRYMLVGSGHHHHIVCNQCHNVVELSDCPLDSEAVAAAQKAGFRIEGHLVEFYGVCNDCALA